MANQNNMCRLEKLLISVGFELVHDGQRNPGQFELPPEEIVCYTRKYRLRMDGIPVNTWAKFTYDGRSQVADFELYSRDPDLKGREKMLLENAE